MTGSGVITAPQVRSNGTALACTTAAWDCQSHSFLGSPETVAANLAALPDDLVQRRVYMIMIQGEGRAEARIFDPFNLDDPDGPVARGQAADRRDRGTEIPDGLVCNKG